MLFLDKLNSSVIWIKKTDNYDADSFPHNIKSENLILLFIKKD